jgi:hypothetical protein
MTNSSLARRITLLFSTLLIISFDAFSQQLRSAPGGRLAVVVDERLAVLREAPELSAKLVRRLGRGRFVGIRRLHRSRDGIVFYRINVTKRKQGWIQREAVASPSVRGDDEKLLHLIRASSEFDRMARAKIFLDLFTRSVWRPAVLLIYAEAAEAAATRLTRDAARRLDGEEFQSSRAPEFSYFANYRGLDRYSRLGLKFVFERETKRFLYSGEAWRELVRRYPRSVEAIEARKRLIRGL